MVIWDGSRQRSQDLPAQKRAKQEHRGASAALNSQLGDYFGRRTDAPDEVSHVRESHVCSRQSPSCHRPLDNGKPDAKSSAANRPPTTNGTWFVCENCSTPVADSPA